MEALNWGDGSEHEIGVVIWRRRITSKKARRVPEKRVALLRARRRSRRIRRAAKPAGLPSVRKLPLLPLHLFSSLFNHLTANSATIRP